jgi:hypothetical protein
MSARLRFDNSSATDLVLAKVGNPHREEPLQTSRTVFKVGDEDRPVLTSLFLKPFKTLTGHRFRHHTSLDQHEMFQCAKAIFADESLILEKGIQMAQRLYAKSNHPNIKAGDLCIALIDSVEINETHVPAICILKSETVTPFLSIVAKDGDLRLNTEHGINPEKIDKGCLIINHDEANGFYVLTFDRGGQDTRFWVKDFLNVVPCTDGSFLTQQYAQMAASFVNKEVRAKDTPEAACSAASEALAFFDNQDTFDLKDFEVKVLKEPELVARFAEHRELVEKEHGMPMQNSFDISQRELAKAKKKINAIVRLDTGVEIHLKPGSGTAGASPMMERGYDDVKGMKFIKVYFNKDLTDTP